VLIYLDVKNYLVHLLFYSNGTMETLFASKDSSAISRFRKQGFFFRSFLIGNKTNSLTEALRGDAQIILD
jgi:hypothetical protein